MSKRIGILTMHDTNNYGSWLQTYALYKKISDMGINVEIIDYQCTELMRREGIKDTNLFDTLKMIDPLERKVCLYKWKRRINFTIYSRKFLKLSKQKYNRQTIKCANLKYDMFLIGSDLVWDTRITGEDFSYMLDFADENKEKCSFSASLGYDELPSKLETTYKRLLNRFDHIAVRETGAKEILQKIIKQKINVTCDPTMLLSSKEWRRFLQKKMEQGKYVLIYMPDEKGVLCHMAKSYAHKNGYKVLFIYGETNGTISVFPTSVSEFLSYIYYAKKVFTASYHGLLFSLYFQKQFTCKYRNPMNRMNEVLNRMKLLWTEVEHSQFDVNREIEYQLVIPLMQKYKEESLNILKEYIL